MVYNAVLILLAVILITVFYFMMSSIKEAEYNTGFMQGKLEGWEEGFNAAKKAYYIAPKEEDDAMRAHIEKLNERPLGITPEILMAYGVDSTSKLPKEIQDAFGFTPNTDSQQLKDLIQEDLDGRV